MCRTLLIALSLWAPLHLFSQQTVGLFQNDSLAVNGYTLFSPNLTTYLIDNCGRVVNTWQSNYQAGSSVYLLEDGNLMRTARISGSFNGGGIGGRLELYSWEGDLLWSYEYANELVHQHHDIEPLPNGNFLVLAWEKRTAQEAEDAGRDPSLTNNSVWPEQIVEIELVGDDDINIVWEWHLWDHLVQDFDPTKENYGVVSDHPELVDVNFEADGSADWIHANAVAYNPELDQIAISSRVFDEIWVIDHSTTTDEAASHSGGNSGKGGDLLYRYGNPMSYDRGDNSDRKLFGQHDVKWVPAGYVDEGKLMVFNNGSGRPGGNHSSIDLIEPPMDADGNYIIEDGEAFGPTELSWTYTTDDPFEFYSQNISGAHRLANGNTLICSGRQGWFFEVTTDGEIVWDYISPVLQNGPVSQGTQLNNHSIFRATRYPEDYAAFEDKDLTPGDPIELDPLPSDCEIFSVQDTVVSFTSTLNTNPVSVQNTLVENMLQLNNPDQNQIQVHIFDLNGRLMLEQKTNANFPQLQLANFPSGLYVIHISNSTINQTYRQRILKL